MYNTKQFFVMKLFLRKKWGEKIFKMSDFFWGKGFWG